MPISSYSVADIIINLYFINIVWLFVRLRYALGSEISVVLYKQNKKKLINVHCVQCIRLKREQKIVRKLALSTDIPPSSSGAFDFEYSTKSMVGGEDTGERWTFDVLGKC